MAFGLMLFVMMMFTMWCITYIANAYIENNGEYDHKSLEERQYSVLNGDLNEYIFHADRQMKMYPLYDIEWF